MKSSALFIVSIISLSLLNAPILAHETSYEQKVDVQYQRLAFTTNTIFNNSRQKIPGPSKLFYYQQWLKQITIACGPVINYPRDTINS